MQVELRDDGGTIVIDADLYPLIGESAHLVLEDYTLIQTDEDEINEETYVTICEDLVFRVLKALVRLGMRLAAPVSLHWIPSGFGGDPELDRAMDRVVKSTIENWSEVMEKVIEDVRRDLELQEQGSDLEWLEKVMKQEALRRGLNKEQREEATIGELFDPGEEK